MIPTQPSNSSVPPVDAGQRIASFTAYADAQRAVDYLSDQGFPVENLSIVGSDLKQVERVVGRMTKLRAALMGAATGAWFGLLVGLLLAWLADSGTAVALIVLWGIVIGAVFGAVWGFLAHLFTMGERDFTTFGVTVPSRVDVLCTPEEAARASNLLAAMPERPAASQSRTTGAR
jgi:tetrahydromethanopterin S-methyltransferase subunit G